MLALNSGFTAPIASYAVAGAYTANGVAAVLWRWRGLAASECASLVVVWVARL
jgi:hypothetical protein